MCVCALYVCVDTAEPVRVKEGALNFKLIESCCRALRSGTMGVPMGPTGLTVTGLSVRDGDNNGVWGLSGWTTRGRTQHKWTDTCGLCTANDMLALSPRPGIGY